MDAARPRLAWRQARRRATLRIGRRKMPVPQQRYDFMAVTFMKGIYWLTGEKVAPVCVRHPYPAPADPAPWEDAFGCPVHFGAAAFVIELPLWALDQPFPTADPTVGEMCERMVAQLAAEQGGCITARVRQVLMQLISKGDPRRELVAATLCMSERTLQRRLTEEGTSFIELVDDTRRELAQRYFVNGAYSPTEMSFALGFSDPSNFYPRLQTLVRTHPQIPCDVSPELIPDICRRRIRYSPNRFYWWGLGLFFYSRRIIAARILAGFFGQPPKVPPSYYGWPPRDTPAS